MSLTSGNFDSGISRYIHAQAAVTVHFPVDEKGNEYICCEACRYYSMNIRRCKLTDEVIVFPGKYVGGECPLERQEGG